MLTLGIFGLLVGLVIAGVPIAISLALTAIGAMWWQGGDMLLIMLSQRMYAATTSFPLLAVPFFILAGNLMNTGGMTQRIFAVARLAVGRLRGGLAQVNVVASVIFAGMSGSAVADAVGLGTIEIPAMEEAGYDRRFAAALTAVASTIGPVIPPSIPFVIYGALANVSVGALFLAGIVPGLLMAAALMLAVALMARRRAMPASPARPAAGEAARIVLDAVPALLTPILVVGGILGRLRHPHRGRRPGHALRPGPGPPRLPRALLAPAARALLGLGQGDRAGALDRGRGRGAGLDPGPAADPEPAHRRHPRRLGNTLGRPPARQPRPPGPGLLHGDHRHHADRDADLPAADGADRRHPGAVSGSSSC